MDELRDAINIMNVNINTTIKKLNKVKENMSIFFNIHNNILCFLEKNNILDKTQEYNLNIIKEEIQNIKYKYNYGKNIYKLLYIYNDMEDKNILVGIEYYPMINKYVTDFINRDSESIRIFGKTFVDKNKDICSIIYSNHEYELGEYIDELEDRFVNCQHFSIQLKGINNVTSMKGMFSNCNNILNLFFTTEWDTSNIIDMSYMFAQCNALKQLPDISKWNTSKVINFEGMFSGCFSITSLPDISNWNTNNITKTKSMFNSCISLLSLPDISKWNTSKVVDMSCMFGQCSALKSLPDLSKWNTKSLENSKSMFLGCNMNSNIPLKFVM